MAVELNISYWAYSRNYANNIIATIELTLSFAAASC